MPNIDADICSSALVRLGAAPISALDEANSDTALACRNIYSRVKENYLSLYNWKFSMKRKQLAKSTNTPINQWKFEYPLPPERISSSTITVYDSDAEGAVPFKRYDRFDQLLFTDAEEIFIVFQENIAEDFWEPYFIELMIFAMAAELAFTITDQGSTARDWERRRDAQFSRAKNRDAQHVPTRKKTNSRIIAARNRSFT